MQARYLKGLMGSYGFAGLNILVQIILMPMYLRYLGHVRFGVLMMLIGYINYAAVGVNWLTGGLQRLFGRFYVQKDVPAFSRAYRLGRQIYVGYAILLGAIMLLIAWIDPGMLFGYPLEISENALRWCVFATVIYLVLFYDLSTDRVALTAIGLQHWAYLYQAGALLIFATGAFFLLRLDASIAGVMAMLSVGALLALIAARRRWRKLSFAPVRSIYLDMQTRTDLLKRLSGKHGAAYFLFGLMVLTMQADVLFLGWLGGASVAAEYVVLWKAAEVSVLLLWRLPETLIPDLIQADVEKNQQRLSALYWGMWRWTLSLSVVGGIAYALLGKLVVGLWLGEQAVPQEPYAFLLAGIAMFFLSARQPAVIFAYATCRFRPLLLIAGLELTIKLAILYWAYPLVGYLAPLLGIIVANVAGIYLLYARLAPRKLAQ